MRKKISSELKCQVALEAIRGLKTINEIASLFEVHPSQVSAWKNQFISNASAAFSKPNISDEKKQERELDNLYRKIGQLEVEKEFLKKKWSQIQAR